MGELAPFVVPEAPAVPESDPMDSARLRLALVMPGLWAEMASARRDCCSWVMF